MNGAITATASGHGVSSSPVCTWLRPSVFSNRNGSDTSAMDCARNEQIDVATDSANSRIFSRSIGSIGERSDNCRVARTKANTMAKHSSAPARLALPP